MVGYMLASILWLATSLQVPSTVPPDFSGTWRLDPARSASAAQVEPIKSMTMQVSHAPDQVTVETTTPKGTTTDVYLFSADTATPTVSRAVARWRGDGLELEALRTISGQSVTTRQVWRLGSQGRELIVEAMLNVQHGYSAADAQIYGAGKDVFVKVTPAQR